MTYMFSLEAFHNDKLLWIMNVLHHVPRHGPTVLAIDRSCSGEEVVDLGYIVGAVVGDKFSHDGIRLFRQRTGSSLRERYHLTRNALIDLWIITSPNPACSKFSAVHLAKRILKRKMLASSDAQITSMDLWSR